MLFPLHEGSCPCSELKEGKKIKKEKKERKNIKEQSIGKIKIT